MTSTCMHTRGWGLDPCMHPTGQAGHPTHAVTPYTHPTGQARHPTHAITRLQGGGGDVENAGPGSGEALPQRNEWRATDRHLKPSSGHSTSAQQCAQHSDRQTDRQLRPQYLSLSAVCMVSSLECAPLLNPFTSCSSKDSSSRMTSLFTPRRFARTKGVAP